MVDSDYPTIRHFIKRTWDLWTVIVIASLLSLFTLWLLENPIKYPLYLLEVALISFLYYVLKGGKASSMGVRINIRQHALVGSILNIAATTLPLVLTATTAGVLDLNGSARLVVTFIVVAFLPGYAVLKLLRLLDRFSILERLVLSYSLSYFLTAFLTFVFSLLAKVEDWSLAVCISYTMLGLFSSLKRDQRTRRRIEAKLAIRHFPQKRFRRVEARPATSQDAKRSSFSKPVDAVLLLVIFLFLGVAVDSVFPEFALLPGMDISRHYVSSRDLVRSPSFYHSYQYLWFHSFSACFYTLSAASITMLQTALMAFNFMPIVAFYIMAKEYLLRIDSRFPIVSTVIWTLFSGLGWIHMVLLKIAPLGVSEFTLLSWSRNQTYRGTIYTQGLWFLGYTPLVASLTFFFLLLYLLKRVDLRHPKHLILFSIVFASSYLTHVTEAIILSVFLGLYLIISSRETSAIRSYLLSISLGYAMIGLVYLSLPFRINFVFSLSSVICILLAASLVGVSYVLPKGLRPRLDLSQKAKRVALPATLTLLFLYILSLLVWSSVKESFYLSHVDEVGFVPWFFYPLMLGVTGILAVIGIYYFFSNTLKYSSLKLFVFFALFALIIGKATSFINVEFFDTGYWEKRFVSFVDVSSAIIALPGLCGIAHAFKDKFGGLRSRKLSRTLVASFLLSLIVMCGISSTFLCIEYWSLFNENTHVVGPTRHELEAISFLDKTFEEKTDSMVITITPMSYEMLVFAAPPYRLYKNFVFYSARNPDLTLNILSSPISSHKYIYLHNRDLVYLRSKFSDTYFAQYMLPNLSPIFNNAEVSVYEAPQLSSPLIEADLALVVPFNQSVSNSTYLYSYDILALHNFTVIFDLDDNIMQENALVLPFDPPLGGTVDQLRDPEDYLKYVRSGGKLVILNTNGYEFFADTLFTRLNATLSTSSIVGSGEILIPNIHVPIIQVSSDVEVLSYYVNPTGGSVPFSMCKAIENGKIFYVNLYPLILTLGKGSTESNSTYDQLERILDVADVDLQSPSYDCQSKMNIQNTFREVNLAGNVNVSTSSILFPLHIYVKTLDITIDGKTSSLSNVSSLMLSNYDAATISTENAKIHDGKGLYARITVNGTIKTTLSGNNVSIMAKTISENEGQEMFLGGSSAQIMLLTYNALDLYVRVPRIEVVGESSFKEMYIDDAMLKWQMRTYGQNLNISGLTNFAIYCSDTYSLAGDFSIEGSFERDPPILEWNEWSTLFNAAFYGFLILPIYIGVVFLLHRYNSHFIRKK